MKYSVVVPVYNAKPSIEELVERIVGVFSELGEEFEIVLVDDRSTDGSWEVVTGLVAAHGEVRALRLRKNMGQQYATLCGALHASGQHIITMDDDLQQSPEDIPSLINAMGEGYDLVFGVFRKYQKGPVRKLGSLVVNTLLRKMNNLPRGFMASSFRVMRRPLAQKVAEFPTIYPHINGIALSMKPRVGNVAVGHAARAYGQSAYSIWRLAWLLLVLFYNCPLYPLRLAFTAGAGLVAVSLAGFAALGAMSGPTTFMKLAPPAVASAGVFLLAASLGVRIALGIVGRKTPRPDYTAQVEITEPGS